MGEGIRARGGGSKGFGSGGVGRRGTESRDGANFRIFDVSNAYKKFFRWYGHGLQGRGLGCRRGLGGGVGAGWQFQRRGRVEAWLAVQKSGGEVPRPLGPRLGLGEGSKGFGCGGVGGRGTAPELTGRRFGRGVGARWQF